MQRASQVFPLYPQVLHLWFHQLWIRNNGENVALLLMYALWLGLLWLHLYRTCTDFFLTFPKQYSITIYIVFGIISNLEMIQNIERMIRSTTTFYTRDLSIGGFWYHCRGGCLGTNLPWIPTDNYLFDKLQL